MMATAWFFALCLVVAAALRVQKEAAGGKPGFCACLNWRDVYESGLARCGDGGELISVGRNLTADTEFCRDAPGAPNSAFYQNQAHEHCINFEKVKGPKKIFPGAWCYVSASCHELSSGSKVNQRVSWKLCAPGKDTLLSDLEPAKLFELARESGKSNTMFALMSYSWSEVHDLFPKPPSVREMFQLIAEDRGFFLPAHGTNKTVLSRRKPSNTISYRGQTWEVTPKRAICVEGCAVE